jgi:hypothetical protein
MRATRALPGLLIQIPIMVFSLGSAVRAHVSRWEKRSVDWAFKLPIRFGSIGA